MQAVLDFKVGVHVPAYPLVGGLVVQSPALGFLQVAGFNYPSLQVVFPDT
jgi:hypothetical protein